MSFMEIKRFVNSGNTPLNTVIKDEVGGMGSDAKSAKHAIWLNDYKTYTTGYAHREPYLKDVMTSVEAFKDNPNDKGITSDVFKYIDNHGYVGDVLRKLIPDNAGEFDSITTLTQLAQNPKAFNLFSKVIYETDSFTMTEKQWFTKQFYDYMWTRYGGSMKYMSAGVSWNPYKINDNGTTITPIKDEYGRYTLLPKKENTMYFIGFIGGYDTSESGFYGDLYIDNYLYKRVSSSYGSFRSYINDSGYAYDRVLLNSLSIDTNNFYFELSYKTITFV